MPAMMQLIKDIFSEPTGGGSASRAVYLPWFWMLTIIHAYISLKTLSLNLEITLTISCALMGQKWLQRREEAKTEIAAAKAPAS